MTQSRGVVFNTWTSAALPPGRAKATTRIRRRLWEIPATSSHPVRASSPFIDLWALALLAGQAIRGCAASPSHVSAPRRDAASVRVVEDGGWPSAPPLVDAVLPRVPVRQWVLTLRYRLRYRLAWDPALCCSVLGVHARARLGFYARTARARGTQDGQTGTVTAIQRLTGSRRVPQRPGRPSNLPAHGRPAAMRALQSKRPRRLADRER